MEAELLDIQNESLWNDTQFDSIPSFPLHLRIWVTVLSGSIFLIGFSGNLLVPILVWRNKELRHSTNVFLVNLALADLLVLLICLPTAFVELHTTPNTWVLGPILCRLVPFVEICVLRASVMTLAVISVERYIAICRPLRSASLCTRPKAVAICSAIWPVSFLAAGPTLIITEYKENVDLGYGFNVTECVTPITGIGKHYFFGSAIIFFLGPLIFLGTVYFFISRQLLSQKTWTHRRIDKIQWQARKQVAVMLAVVIIIFFVCLFPFNIFTLWLIVSPFQKINELGPILFYNILYVCRTLIYVNSAVNPIIYNVMSAKFRNALKRLFCSTPWSGSYSMRRYTLSTTLSSASSPSLSRSNSVRRTLSHSAIRRFSDLTMRKNSIKTSVDALNNTGTIPNRKVPHMHRISHENGAWSRRKQTHMPHLSYDTAPRRHVEYRPIPLRAITNGRNLSRESNVLQKNVSFGHPPSNDESIYDNWPPIETKYETSSTETSFNAMNSNRSNNNSVIVKIIPHPMVTDNDRCYASDVTNSCLHSGDVI